MKISLQSILQETILIIIYIININIPHYMMSQ